MRLPAERQAELYAEGLKRIAGSGENDYRQFLLAECLEAYSELDEAQKERLQALLHSEAYQEVEPLMKTTYERGIEQGIERGIERGIEQGIERGIERGIEQGIERGIERGIEQGIERGIEQGERRSALRLMQAKFGPLSPKVKKQVESMSPEALARLQIDLLNAQALEELRLDD